MIKSRISLILPILIVLSLATISAQTLVAGQIYNSDYSDKIGGASILVTCNSNFLSTTSLEDGTYAVRFEESACIENDTASVIVKKSGFNDKIASGVINKCEEGECGGSYFTIINFGLEVKLINTNNGKGGNSYGSIGNYYLCGNGICDTGESIKTCPIDCKVIELSEKSTEKAIDLNKENSEESNSSRGKPSPITGAVIGALTNGRGIIVLAFLIILITGYLFVRKYLKKRNK